MAEKQNRTGTGRRSSRRRLNGLLLVLVSCALTACGPDTAQTTEAAPPPDTARRLPVEVSEVQRRHLTETLALTGTVKPWETVAVTSEIGGQINAIHVEEGDYVREGQLLLELDRSKKELQLERRAAEIERAEVELEFAESRLSRAEKLFERGAISEAEVENLRERVAMARSTLRLARIARQTLEDELADTRIYAPMAGRISERMVSLGETVNPATLLFTLLRTAPVKVVTEISEEYLQLVQPGQRVPLSFEDPAIGRAVGRVHRVHPVASASGAFPLEIRVANERRLLQPGMIARVQLEGRSFDSALTVPLEAVVGIEGRDFVFVVEDGRARRKTVSVVETIDGWAVIEASGLDDGQRVVVRGNSNLTEGTAVDVNSVLLGS